MVGGCVAVVWLVVVSSHLVVVRFIPGDSIDVNQHFPDDRCIDRELRCRAAMAPTCHEGTCDAIGEHVYNYLTLTDPCDPVPRHPASSTAPNRYTSGT